MNVVRHSMFVYTFIYDTACEKFNQIKKVENDIYDMNSEV